MFGTRLSTVIVIATALGVIASPGAAMAATPVDGTVAGSVAGTVASTAATTGTVTVMLMNPQKEPFPLVNVGVSMVNENGVRKFGLTNLEGEVTLTNVPVGSRWHIIATPQQVAGRWALLTGMRWDVTVTAGQHDWVVVVLRYGGSINGTVSTAAGPSRLATVTAVGGWSNGTYQTSTNGSGKYELGGLPSGDYVIYFRFGDYPVAKTMRHITAQYADNPWSVLTGVDAVITR